jgi:hypothetical protein
MNESAARNEAGVVSGAVLQVGTIHGDMTVRMPVEVPPDDPALDPIVTDVRLRDVDYVAFTDGDVVEEVPASGHTVQVIVTGATRTPVVLAEMRAEVLARNERSGALNRHAAEVPRRRFEVLLDAVPPRLRPLADSDFPYSVGLHESEVFELKTVTEHGDVEWVLWLDWLCGRRRGTVRIDLGGHAFRTAGRHARLPGR